MGTNKSKVFLTTLILLLTLGFTLAIYSSQSSSNYIIINDQKFFVEIADSPEKRAFGLMGRESLCVDCGMFFIFESEDKHNFWMKNTLIDLDIIFIDSSLTVVDIIYAVPCVEAVCDSYVPQDDALYVLEINGNSVDDKIIGSSVITNFL